MAEYEAGPSIVVGVVPGQPDEVTLTAARFATLIGARLEFVFVDVDRYSVAGMFTPADPIVGHGIPARPDDGAPLAFDEDLASHLGALVGPSVRHRTHRLTGDPAHALSVIAEQVGAEMIVVGTRESTVRASVREFFNGSVAVHLTHRQHRPVLVVPLAPVAAGEDLPWG